MQAKKRCVRCNEVNEAGRSYCVRCGTYLTDRVQKQRGIPTVWETELTDVLAKAAPKEQILPSEDVIICPECGEKIPVADGLFPLACIQCGYFFQVGRDQAAPPQGQKLNPMARVPNDTSSMRLHLLSQPGVLPEPVGEQGGILGENGTLLRQLGTKEQISIRHTPTGWYAMTIKGQPYYNGVPQNAGRQLRLSDGDLIIMDKEQIRVEIT